MLPFFLILKEKKENNTMLKYRESSRDHDFLKSSIYPPVIVRGGILRGIERRGLFDKWGGGGGILFSEDYGINSRHKKTKTKVEKLGHMKFRGHAAEIKNKSEIPSLEKFIAMKVLHS